jgi:hypothetical protein
MSDNSATRIGRKKQAFRASHLASSIVTSYWGLVKMGKEGRARGGKLFDLAHFAIL